MLTREAAFDRAAQLIRAAKYAVVFTGAGISTPSGIPDFRSAGTGQWTKFDPMQVASHTAYRIRPAEFYNWLRPLAKLTLAALPNPAHLALAQLEAAGKIQAVVTQNVDGLHQRAGSQRVLELHGTLHTFTCPNCRRGVTLDAIQAEFVDNQQLPRCQHCQTILKPDMVLYEEMLPEDVWRDAEQECTRADLMIVIGSSLDVGPANMLPLLAAQVGAPLIINTFSPTMIDSQAELLLPYDIAECIPALAARALSV